MEWSLHSAVGLDPQRRGQAEQLLAEAMLDPERNLRHRTEIAWAALKLSEQGSSNQRACAEVIGQGWAAEEDSKLRDTWRAALLARVGELAPADAARLLNQVLAQEKDATVRYHLATLLAMTWGLDPNERARVCAEAARVLNQALAQEKDENARQWLAEGLVTVAGGMEPNLAARLLNEALAKENEANVRRQLAVSLAYLAERWEPNEAARVCAEAVGALNQALAQEKDENARRQLVLGLVAVAGRLEPNEAARSLNQALDQAKVGYVGDDLAQELVAVAGRLEPKAAAQLLNRALRLPRVGNDVHSHKRLAQGLAAVARRLEPSDAARASADTARALNWELGCLLPDPELDPFPIGPWPGELEAAQVLATAQAVAAVAGCLEPKEAARVCSEAAGVLNRALAQEMTGTAYWSLAVGLAEVAGRLEPKEAARVCAEAARVLNQRLHQANDAHELAKGLVAVAGRLDPKEAARIYAEAAGVLNQAANPGATCPSSE